MLEAARDAFLRMKRESIADRGGIAIFSLGMTRGAEVGGGGGEEGKAATSPASENKICYPGREVRVAFAVAPATFYDAINNKVTTGRFLLFSRGAPQDEAS